MRASEKRGRGRGINDEAGRRPILPDDKSDRGEAKGRKSHPMSHAANIEVYGD